MEPYLAYLSPGAAGRYSSLDYSYATQSFPAEQTCVTRVPNFEVVEASRVPLDGRVVYFMLNDNSAICTKFIDMNGNAVIRKYVLQETPSNNKTIEERIANLEAIVSQMRGVNVNVPTATSEPVTDVVQPVHESSTV